jgi:hypothetical protein
MKTDSTRSHMVSINVIGLANLHGIKFTVKEVLAIVGCSERTFYSRAKAGKLKTTQSKTEFCRDGRPRIYVTADDLADFLHLKDEATARAYMNLPPIEGEQEPTPEDRKMFADVSEPYTPRRVPVIGEPDAFRPQENGFSENAAANQEKWNTGAVTDSLGNNALGNESRPTTGVVSLIGPHEPMPRVRPDSTAHMNPALVGCTERVENPVDSDDFRELLNPGFKERKTEMYASAGIKQPSEQEGKQRNDIAMIRAAFRTGTWSR